MSKEKGSVCAFVRARINYGSVQTVPTMFNDDTKAPVLTGHEHKTDLLLKMSLVKLQRAIEIVGFIYT